MCILKGKRTVTYAEIAFCPANLMEKNANEDRQGTRLRDRGEQNSMPLKATDTRNFYRHEDHWISFSPQPPGGSLLTWDNADHFYTSC